MTKDEIIKVLYKLSCDFVELEDQIDLDNGQWAVFHAPTFVLVLEGLVARMLIDEDDSLKDIIVQLKYLAMDIDLNLADLWPDDGKYAMSLLDEYTLTTNKIMKSLLCDKNKGVEND